MKLSLISDLHLGFGKTIINNTDNCQLLILAGDIFEINHLDSHIDWLIDVCKKWERVLFIMGNHEHYGQNIQDSKEILLSLPIRNLHIIEDEVLYYEDVRIIGCTLWTDLNKGNPVMERIALKNMNDYRHIRYHDTKLQPYHTKFFHRDSLSFIKKWLSEPFEGKTIVATHHAPSFKSIPKKFEASEVNHCYYSDLDYMMYDYSIDYWVHGHIHEKSDYMINNTRVLCNPHGYVGYETEITETTPLTIEV